MNCVVLITAVCSLLIFSMNCHVPKGSQETISFEILSRSVLDCLKQVDGMEWSEFDHPELAYVLYACDGSCGGIQTDVFLGALVSIQQLIGPSVCDDVYNALLVKNNEITEDVLGTKELESFDSQVVLMRNPALADRTAIVNIIMGNQGEIKFQELTTNGTEAISMQAPGNLTAGSYTLTLPNGAGTNGQVLATNGSGVLSWVTNGSGDIVNGGQVGPITVGTNDATAFNLETNNTNRLVISSAGTVTIPNLTLAGVVHNSAGGLLTTSLIVNADVSASAAIVDTKLATISTASKVANSATTATSTNTNGAIVARDGSGNFVTSTGTFQASIVLEDPDAGTNTITIQAPATLAVDYTLTLPINAGTGGQVLTTNGSGVLSWVTSGTGNIVNGGQTGPITVGTNNATSLNLETNNVNRLTIDSSGNTTFSSNYKMRAYSSTNQTLGVTNTPVVVVFNSEAFDPNNNYNTANGVYTAPVTGYYWVSSAIALVRGNGPNRVLEFYNNGSPIAGTRLFDNPDNVTFSFTQIALINLSAGDALTVRVTGDNGDVISANNANFSVHFMST